VRRTRSTFLLCNLWILDWLEYQKTRNRLWYHLKDRTSNQRGRGSEWETIKILLEGGGFSNKSNTTWPNHFSDSTTQVGQEDHVPTRVLLVIGASTHRNLLEEHSRTRKSSSYWPHRSDRSRPNHLDWATRSPDSNQRHTGSPWKPTWITQVRLDDFHRRAPAPVRTVQHTSQTGPRMDIPNPRIRPPELQTTQNLEQQRT
jgi:hypothetical protein